MKKTIEIMDTTLRDGEQTSGVSYTSSEKLQIAKLLLKEVKVNRIEVASARVSKGELEGVQKITEWCKEENLLDKVEVLGFVDGGTSIDWIKKSGAKVINLLTKGSLNHLTYQLKKTPEQHFSEIADTISYANENDISVNVYLEDWSNGMKDSKEYVFQYIDFLKTQPVKRIMLPDTLGVLTPELSYQFIKETKEKYPTLHFDFHTHNDYDLSVVNTWEAVKAGVDGFHTTVNGMGERAGNVPLASIVAVLNDFEPNSENTVDESKLFKISKIVETFSGIRIPANKPVVGDNVFTQTAGIHADGDNKKNLYFNDLLPERFGRDRKYALGKTSGKANILKNIQELGIQLDEEQLKAVTERIIQLGDKKEKVTQDDLPYIISDVLNNSKYIKNNVSLENYCINHAFGLKPTASICMKIDNEIYHENASGDGQYDAFMNAVKKIYTRLNKEFPILTDYTVRIPPGGKTDALCETIIKWNLKKEFITRGLDSDQTFAAIKATEKMLNLI
ncbi:MAG: 2-isopropylmalate synthase [Flavobacteriales bacterium]|nr:2-isopropylmalate synthase [Flavobacteriales bacterium]